MKPLSLPQSSAISEFVLANYTSQQFKLYTILVEQYFSYTNGEYNWLTICTIV